MSDLNLQAYQMDEYFAPNRCEMCNIPLPDESSRRSHMAETEHCTCSGCNGYVPVGQMYGHYAISKIHAKDEFNDHGLAHADTTNMNNAEPWTGTKDYLNAVQNTTNL